MMNTKMLRIKNSVLVGVAVVYYVICRLFSLPLITDPCEKGGIAAPSSDITVYLKGNIGFIAFFLLFVSFASTSFLLGYLIYQKFDRNRAASLTAVRAGAFFAFIAAYMATGTNSLDIFSSQTNTFDYISSLSVMFAALMFVAYWSTVYTKKWVIAADAVFSAMTLLVFVLGIFNINPHAVHWILSCYNLLFMLFMVFCSLIFVRLYLRKGLRYQTVKVVLGIITAVFLQTAQVMFLTKHMVMYWLFFASGLAVMGYLMFSELVSIAARQYAQSADAENYRKMAYIDALCEISNRNAFVQEQNNTYNSDSLYYVVFDVNNLKRINDAFGHSEGDEIIRRAAHLIRDSFKSIGKCYRIGGDEFAVIGQYKTAEEIRACLRQMRLEIDKFNTTSSAKLDLAFGYVIRENTDINTYELFNKADKAMYRYKRRAKASLASA